MYKKSSTSIIMRCVIIVILFEQQQHLFFETIGVQHLCLGKVTECCEGADKIEINNTV